MKVWVREFLIERYEHLLRNDPRNKNLGPKFLEFELKMFSKSLTMPESYYGELENYLKFNFGSRFDFKGNLFYNLFFSVITDLPREVFENIYKMKNLFFIYTPNPGAEIKYLYSNYDIKSGRIIVVNFPFQSIEIMSHMAIKGTIAHEIAHLYKHIDILDPDDSVEDDANDIASKWGFEKEILQMKIALKEMGDEGQVI